ncbi:hypothetical protein DFJ73DRAFT_842466 [Zopfochytrium polystomum]|nr:hypothetical protein DFJ73DRAFT_842466 [Zopfochytrium polystomum]
MKASVAVRALFSSVLLSSYAFARLTSPPPPLPFEHELAILNKQRWGGKECTRYTHRKKIRRGQGASKKTKGTRKTHCQAGT